MINKAFYLPVDLFCIIALMIRVKAIHYIKRETEKPFSNQDAADLPCII